MGVFGEYTGCMDIPNEQKKEFADHMIKLLGYGGMMRFETVSMFDKEIYLLIPVNKTGKEAFEFHYNYFEDMGWESAWFDTETCKLETGKIGSYEFDMVIMAAYMLYEAYLSEDGFAKVSGDYIDSTCYMGWINQVLGTSFSMKNRFHLWDNIETIFLPEIEEYSTKALNFWISKAIMEIIPTGMEFEAAGLDYSDLKYILNGTESLDEDKDSLEPGTYPCDVYKCKCLVREYLENNTEESLDRFIRLLKKSYGERKKETDPTLVQVAEMTLCMPARVFLYLAAELMPEIDFWKLWKEHKDMVYHDEKIKAYAPDEIVAWRTERREMPIAPVRTSDFLKQDDGFTFWHTPDEIKHKPNYYLSDDDRMYWWDGTDEVIISEKTKDWLRELARQHKEIMENQDLSGISEGFIRYFIDTVSEANEYYKRIYPFQSMFYEFLENKQKTEYIVALKLFRNLVDSDDYRKEGAIIKYANGRSWDITSRNVTHNEARIKLKRYLSVMANVDLRKKYFGF